MVSKRKKKYTTGEGNQFYPRTKAMKKLQVSLNQFRRLCIIKGIYPREPRSRKRAQKGAPGIKILYHKKDIQFLLHEPIMWTLRDINVHNNKLARARAIKDHETRKRLEAKHPELKLDHIVKERYPTFIDAIRDLDDCLTLCFLFSTFPSMARIPKEQFDLCRRLTVEFLHAVIEAKALRKVFISIKGYYYQAEIKGQTITWIVPHHFCYEPQKRKEVDFKLMATFVEFYVVMLGFVNYRLYNSLNLYYPPKFAAFDNPSAMEKGLVDENAYVSERVAALNFPLSKTSTSVEEEDVEIDQFNDEENPEKMEEVRKEVEAVKNLKTLFKGLKFYLNREVPRESLVFIIRCFGGEVSWDKTLFLGSTFAETDETITHQIVDRPSMDKQYISRYYVQPQWIFDSVNARQLLPVNKYFIGEILPPHLSPFVEKDRDEAYIPPEEKALYDPELLEKLHNKEIEDEESDDEENMEETEQQAESSEEDEVEGSENEDVEETVKEKKKKLSVKKGEVFKEAPGEEKRRERQEYKLREKMVKNKHRKLYKNMMLGRMNRQKEAWLLKKKRTIHEEKEKQEKKVIKKRSLQQATKTS